MNGLAGKHYKHTSGDMLAVVQGDRVFGGKQYRANYVGQHCHYSIIETDADKDYIEITNDEWREITDKEFSERVYPKWRNVFVSVKRRFGETIANALTVKIYKKYQPVPSGAK